MLNSSAKTNCLSRFLAIYLTFGCVLLIYSLLYNYSAMAYGYEWKEILFAFSLAVVIMFCFSFMLAILSYGVEVFLKKINILSFAAILILSSIFIIIGKYNFEFIKRLSFFGAIFEYYRSLSSLTQNCLKLAAPLAIFALVVIFRKQCLKKFEEFISVFKYFGISVVLLSVMASVAMPFFLKASDYRKQTSYKYKHVSIDKKDKPNIILLTCESLSSPKISLYDPGKNNTPNINRLAEESYVFKNMHAAGNVTAIGMPSIVEGVYQPTHKVYYSGFISFKRPDENLASILSSKGYRTYALEILNHISTRRWWEYMGSFSHIEPALGEPGLLEDISLKYNIPLHSWLLKITKEDVLWPLKTVKFFCKNAGFKFAIKKGVFTDDILQRVGEIVINSKEPYFIWAYLPDLHPFYLPELYRKRFLRENIKNIYYDRFGRQVKTIEFYTPTELDAIKKIEAKHDEAIVSLDRKLGKFVQFLKDKGAFDNCILIITADHGISFRKGFVGHSSTCLSEEVVSIPLILHMPNQKEGMRIRSLASQVDIAPTILELCDINKAESMEGESLVPFMKDENLLTHKPKFSMALRIIGGEVKGGTIAVFKDRYKMVYDLDENKAELYNIYKDPGEKENILGEREDIAEILNKLILKSIKQGK